jgi:hypothetical protein
MIWLERIELPLDLIAVTAILAVYLYAIWTGIRVVCTALWMLL